MNRRSPHRHLLLSVLLACAPIHAQKWTAPTPEELSMTAQPEVPDADAIYLYREEINDDNEATFNFYIRIKVLKANARSLARPVFSNTTSKEGLGSVITNFVGRTIDPDGTVIPMTERPIEDVTHPPLGGKIVRSTYNLPQPKIGGIIEYRFTRQFTGELRPPNWAIQNRLFTRKAHFSWVTSNRTLAAQRAGELQRNVNSIRWSSHLPDGVELKKNAVANGGNFELTVTNVPPFPTEGEPAAPLRNRLSRHLRLLHLRHPGGFLAGLRQSLVRW